ncbi:MAG TPA: MoxR family ATPase [Dehalococcoidia bacterium]|nr:MoxR family ATPase [Dehalococcoidia bacterium]
MTSEATPQTQEPQSPIEQVLFEVKRVIVGQEALLERMLVALLARGHILVEGVPGLAKTLAIRTVAQVIGGTFDRIQFTPDLVPADLIGTRIYNQKTGEFTTSLGPVFTNLLLADEINRAPAKVQSALLEVMQERQVTIGRDTHEVPDPFLVLATQNPIETEGTYALPEAQVDRFMMKVLVDYPSEREELVIVERMARGLDQVRQIITADDLLRMQREADAVYVDPQIMEYAVQMVGATRRPAEYGAGDVKHYIAFGASPRASINLVLGARALAMLRGRDYVVPGDIADLAPDVLRHRVVLSYEALADNVTPDAVIRRIMDVVARPARPMMERGQGPAATGGQAPPTPAHMPAKDWRTA